jgi:hypothetical protein
MLNNKEQLLTENLPFFPLGIVVLPGETRFLHIFEQRYKNLFEDISKFNNCFCIPFVVDGKTTQTGSLVKMEKVLVKYPNGEVDIAVKGIDIVLIKNYEQAHAERLYPYGDIEYLDKKSVKASENLLSAFDKYNEKILKVDLVKYEVNFYLIANSIGLSDIEKYDILIRKDEKQMNKALTNYIRLKAILVSQQDSIHEFYCLN